MGFIEIDHKAAELSKTQRAPDRHAPYSSFDGMMFYDKRQRTLIDNEEVQLYIEKQNEVDQRLRDVTNTWHMQKEGKLSKKVFGRIEIAMEGLIKDFTK